jgi:SAM-dependent methyltransferase
MTMGPSRKVRGDWLTPVLIGLFALMSVLVVAGPARRQTLSRTIQYGGWTHQCNICGRSLRAFAESAEHERMCPFCYSRPRHRTAWRYFTERSDLFDGRPKRMLHIAPEYSLAPKFRAAPNIDYLSGDLEPGAAMVVMDITDIHYPDASFDVIYCSHVLEHVPEDRKAMRELARVLKPGGWAIIAVPILRSDHTFEDPAITSPEERQRVYGQFDHVRAYGPDFADRLRESGFDVTVDRFAAAFTDEEVRRYGLSREAMYVCRKAKAAS